MLRILIVDDSATARYHLCRALESDPDILIIGEVETGRQLRDFLKKNRPDLITMDIYLRRENGIDLTSEIMHASPIPILMVTGVDPRNPQTVFRALEAGALDVAPKLPPKSSPLFESERRSLLRIIKNLAQVPVVTKRRYTREISSVAAAKPVHYKNPQTVSSRLVVIAASTGGPPALLDIFNNISKGEFGSILVVQHIASGFAGGLARWLASESGHKVVLVEKSETMQSNTIYLAADNHHMALVSRNVVAPDNSPPVANLRPAADVLFRSAAECYGREVLGIVLTGMGQDGSEGFAALAACGAQLIVQDEQSCLVSSMPKRAKRGLSAVRSMDPNTISRHIASFFLCGKPDSDSSV